MDALIWAFQGSKKEKSRADSVDSGEKTDEPADTRDYYKHPYEVYSCGW